jgi:hypothetical protein
LADFCAAPFKGEITVVMCLSCVWRKVELMLSALRQWFARICNAMLKIRKARQLSVSAMGLDLVSAVQTSVLCSTVQPLCLSRPFRPVLMAVSLPSLFE